MNNHVIGINTFIKTQDTLRLINSLNNCIGVDKYKLCISIDSTNYMAYENKPEWVDKNIELRNQLIELSQSNKFNFKSIELIILETNRGPYGSCKTIIDHSMKYSDYVIFLEDDCIVSYDFLLYHEYMEQNFAYKDPKAYAIASSLMYWPKNYSFGLGKIDKVYKANWVPSFEFGITDKIWQTFGEHRGKFPEGDIYFGQACRDNNMYSFYPMIPRCYRDVYQKDSYSAYYAPEKNIEEKIPVLSENKNNITYQYSELIYE